MTALLDEAVRRMRALPEAEQDAAAREIFGLLDRGALALADDQLAIVRERQASAGTADRLPLEQVLQRISLGR